jgi:hypothetical protein
MRIRQRVEEALERDGRGVEATVEDRERSAFGRGEEWRKRGGASPQRSEMVNPSRHFDDRITV